MLAARNRWFRIAAALAGVAWLVLGALDLIDVIHLFGETVRGGYNASQVLFVAVHLVGAVGWFMVASAFGAEIDWGTLRAGAGIVAAVYLVYFVAWMFRLFAVFADTHNADYRGYFVAAAIGALAFGVGACIAATGFSDARAGAARAARLRLGAILIAAATSAVTVSVLYLQSFYAAAGAVSEATIGTLITAVGTLATAVAFLALVRGARRPLATREKAVGAAGVIGVIGTACIAAGEALIALGYSTRGGAPWQQEVAWLAVASRVVLIAAFAAVALGARAARDESALGVAGAP